MSNVLAEKRALIVGAVINFLMAMAGWAAYYYSSSQAILLDGNFSFIAFLVTLIAIKISAIKSNRTQTFPLGQFAYEALFSFAKGILLIGVLLMAFSANFSKIIQYLNGESLVPLNGEVILYYTPAMVVLCFSLAYFCHFQNRKVNFSSTILKAEFTSSRLDGVMSLATGLALISIRFVDIDGVAGFLHYIGDSLLVIVLVLLLGKGPFVLVRDSFIELAGGQLQNQQDRAKIMAVLEARFGTEGMLKDSFISKTGSSYLVVAYIDSQALGSLSMADLMTHKHHIVAELADTYPNSTFEIALT
ncbi:cation transporter [Motilimonas pumila]|uniref:Cation transporter n=1 Tax=Motilimonas pumila TaxID=2303987 RepID=A0A418YF82_9GAMM|nr:cation transporter [Motilimonas pumila]RJG47920.1 cation transporter [Motilimonas pumila]